MDQIRCAAADRAWTRWFNGICARVRVIDFRGTLCEHGSAGLSSFSQQLPCVTSTRAVMATNQQQQHTYTMCCVCVYMFVGYYLQRRRKALVYCEECGVPDIALGSFLRSNYSLGLVVTWGEWLPVRVFGVACIYCCSFRHNVIGLLSDCSLGCVVHKWPNARQPNIPAYMPSRSLATHARTHTRCCWIVYMGVYTHAYTCTYITYTHTHMQTKPSSAFSVLDFPGKRAHSFQWLSNSTRRTQRHLHTSVIIAMMMTTDDDLISII